MVRTRVAGLALVLALSAVVGPSASAFAGSAPVRAGTAAMARIIVRAIDRNGHQFADRVVVAVPVGFITPFPEYSASASGVLDLPPGRYLLGTVVYTSASGASQASGTLMAQVVRVRTVRTVTFDARQGRRVLVSLRIPGVQEVGGPFAVLCAPQSDLGIQLAQTDGAEVIFAVPSRAPGLQFAFGADWQGTDGSGYLVGGVRRGIPGALRFSFGQSDLATLTLRVAAGASNGGSGYLQAFNLASCGATDGTGTAPSPVPFQTTLRVSAGKVGAVYLPFDRSDDTSGRTGKVLAGHRYTWTFGQAVRGPSPDALPRYFTPFATSEVILGLGEFWSDPLAHGAQCCADGVVKLSARGRTIRTMRFRGGNGQYFKAWIRHAGWYTLSVTARRTPPPAGVTAAVLSARVGLTWRFHAPGSHLGFLSVPVSMTTLLPQGLDLRNDAAPRAVTPLVLRIWRGLHTRGYRITKVQLLVSFDDGRTWRPVRVAESGGNWLARVHDPASGFVSLRTIVTDVTGDRSVQTIIRGYGIR
ncbi:MAG TPA: hypothetical protein VNF47_20225 [Streptosporangiaceae bacterium]|nr:hypothetical protein [Streptosporangiaceae bacterium]